MLQVQEEISQLRLAQAERQLQLKEASTRRKLQEFKQQLLHSNTAQLSADLADTQRGVQSEPRSTVIPGSQSVINPCSHFTAHKLNYTPPATAPVERQASDGRRHKEASLDVKKINSKLGRRTLFPSDHLKESSHDGPEVPTTTVDETAITVATTSHCEQPVTKPLTYVRPPDITVQKCIQHSSHGPQVEKDHTQNQQISSKLHSKTPKLLPHKLESMVHVLGTGQKTYTMLLEEIKERAYMSEVHQQKERVLKIRKCISAATVIQRAWRRYRQ